MDEERWNIILSYIDTHIKEHISLLELAELAGYSPFYFSKLFSETMGIPVTGYIRIRKLQYAVCSLLEGERVLDVSLMYAFDSHEGFTRAFTQVFGSTPSKVRKFLTSYEVPPYVVPDGRKGNVYMVKRNVDKENQESLQGNMHQLVFEVLRESLEEAEAGYCTEIVVTLLEDNRIKIKDNGRGIPLSGNAVADKEILDKILAGKPLTAMEYSQMGDFENLGLQTINSLCENLQVNIYRGNTHFRQDYVRGIPQHELMHELLSETPEHPSGTEIILKPDTVIWGDTHFSEEMIAKWIQQEKGSNKYIKIDLQKHIKAI